MNVLVFDVGNTNTTIGLFCDNKLIDWYRIRTDIGVTPDEIAIKVRDLIALSYTEELNFDDLVVSSVVPEFSDILERYSLRYMKKKPFFISHRCNTAIRIGYTLPEQVGADRIANCEAAFCDYGGQLIVVDFGTACTFDFISRDGIYEGGAIAPGFDTFISSLYKRTAKLWRVELQHPERAVGKNTPESLISGLVNGYKGMVEFVIEKIKKEKGYDSDVIYTGGEAKRVVNLLSLDGVVDDTLTLRGCVYIYLKNLKGNDNG